MFPVLHLEPRPAVAVSLLKQYPVVRTFTDPSNLHHPLVCWYCLPLINVNQNDPDKICVSQEYLHGLRVALETERRRVEELEAEVCRLNKELAVFRVSDGFLDATSIFVCR